jgi:hypothetical protein
MKKIQSVAALATFLVLMLGLLAAVRIPIADQKGAALGLIVTLIVLNSIFVAGFAIVLVDRYAERH